MNKKLSNILLSGTQEHEMPTPETEDTDTTDLVFRVVLYNDDWHTFDEVISQLIKAINCSIETAQKHTYEVHYKGKSIVFNGSLLQCLRVSSILEEIALHTQIISE